MLGYDWPRLHAALNDFPAALLLVSVLFDAAGAVTKRESLRVVGFWTLVTGVLGTGAAVIAGLQAEDVIEHSDEAHAIMEQHETLGFMVLGVFGVLALWRVLRRGVWRPKEQPFALAAGLVGLVLLVRTAQIGGTLVFDHALGISNARMHSIEEQRGAEAHEHEGAADSSKAMDMNHDSVPHTHN
jgi:uncharacterized membrane protein